MYELQDLLNDHQLYHSEFQQDYFITSRAGGTLYGQYKQALRELYKRTRGLRETTCDHSKLNVEINKLKDQLENLKYENDYDKQLDEIELKRKQMLLEESERVVKETKREFERFYKQAAVLKKKITDKYGELTSETRKKLDEDLWFYRLKEMVTVDHAVSGRIGRSAYEFIMASPPEFKCRLLKEVSDYPKLKKWYESDISHFRLNEEELNQIKIESGVVDRFLESGIDEKAITE